MFGNNATCTDGCGLVHGDNSTCAGCDSVPYSGLLLDGCNICGGDNSTCTDCLGVLNGSARHDGCTVCNGDNSTCAGCDGQPNSGLFNDVCGLCGGNGTGCVVLPGCDGVIGSGLVVDSCLICGGLEVTLDLCGVCDGDGRSCFQPVAQAAGAESITAAVVLDIDISSIADRPAWSLTFATSFKADMAGLIGGNVTADQVLVNSITAGSVVVEFTIVPDSRGAAVTPGALANVFATAGISIAGAFTESVIVSSDVAVTPSATTAGTAAGSGADTGGVADTSDADVPASAIPSSSTLAQNTVFGMSVISFTLVLSVVVGLGVCLLALCAQRVTLLNKLVSY